MLRQPYWIVVDGVNLCVCEQYELRYQKGGPVPPIERAERIYSVHSTVGDCVEHPVLDEAIRLWRLQRMMNEGGRK